MTLPAEPPPVQRSVIVPPAVNEKPLRGVAKLLVIASAGLAIALFYISAFVFLVVLSLWVLCELALALAAARVGGFGFVKQFIERHGQVLVLFFRSLPFRRRRPEFRVSLQEPEAPRLFAVVRTLSQRFGVAAPREVVIEMNASAWVLLKGLRRGANATTLGLGYDLIAGLSEREMEAVVAHEMAHAKFVHRGYKRVINVGMAHAAQFTGSLSAMVEAYRRAKRTFYIGEWLVTVFDPLTRLVARLVAAYSRQDEFEADLGAAQACGSAPLRSALTKLDHIDTKTSRISWTERLARLQQGNGFGNWLAEELLTGDATARRETNTFDRYSTHPSLHDRLAALPEDDALSTDSRPAIELFANPHAVAQRVVAEIHRISALEEQRNSRTQLKWLKEVRSHNSLHSRRNIGIFFGALALGGAIIWPFDQEPVWLEIAVTFAVLAAPLFWFARYRGKGHWPIPDYDNLHAAWIEKEDSNAREAREKTIKAEIDASLANQNRDGRTQHLIEIATQALARCDYLHALLALRKAQEFDKKSPEILMGMAVSLAGTGDLSGAHNFLSTVIKRIGLPTPNLLWSAAWMLALCGEWQSAEPILETLRCAEPDNPTFLALLATCQGRSGKLQIGSVNAQRAFEAAPQSKYRLELLVDLLIQAGRVAEAERLLTQAGPMVEKEPALIESMIWLLLTKRDFATADIWITRLRAYGIPGHTNVSLASMYETARRDDMAETYFLAALEQGFHPIAELGLARLAHHRKDEAAARDRALLALDTDRPLASKAVAPLLLFDAVLRFLTELESPMADAKAFVCILNPDLALGVLSRCKFLVFSRDAEHAENLVLSVLNAIKPKSPPITPSDLQIQKAPDDRQPVGAVRAGILSYWK